MDRPDNTQQQQEHRPRHHHSGRGRGRGRGRPVREPRDESTMNPASTHDERTARGPQRRPPRSTDGEPAPSVSTAPASRPPRPSRRGRFQAKLTETSQAQTSTQPDTSQKEGPNPPATLPTSADSPKPTSGPKSSFKSRHKPRRRDQPHGDDLTSTLTHALRTPPFPDCPICFSPIRPEDTTWSCSPPTSTEAAAVPERKDGHTDGDGDGSHCCWATFHLKCIRAWAEKSVKELEEAWRARGEVRPGEWHCPGCRATRRAVPRTYMCFCLRMRNPAAPRIATPHSCAQSCSRPRMTCSHACPLPCHPGPCPPCAVTVRASCFCGREQHSAQCRSGNLALAFSCAKACGKPLECGNMAHRCASACHAGACPPCPAREDVRCWCGRETKSVACGEGEGGGSAECVVAKEGGSEEVWVGSYGCGRPCERPFACSQHGCTKACHPPSRTPPPCPFDPERVLACACGRHRVARSSEELAASSARRSDPLVLPPRSSCTSPLPTCPSRCAKPLACGHPCQATCHWGSCPPCTEQVERSCRCGATKTKTPCGGVVPVVAQGLADGETPASRDVLCDRPCQAMRACGRHQCGRICCPLAPQRTAPSKAPKRRDPLHPELDPYLTTMQTDSTTLALHECPLPCGRVLGCGNHRCTANDHRGQCAPCPRGIFDELMCSCGRTTLEPPIRCGTRLRCVYPCARPPPACGHPHVVHACHEGVVVAGADTADGGLGLAAIGASEVEGRPCPPCPFLTEKLCACGKKHVGNVRCSQERVSCGSVCGKLLACGFHHCERLCHADACGMCTAVCGKARKSCLPATHPCTQTCHAPAACPETEPCLAPVTHTCPCGNLRSTVPCSGTRVALACTGECEIKKRNARLAEALGIGEERREAGMGARRVVWSAELVGVARGLGPKFMGIVEKAFADFVASDRSRQVLPHMPLERRKFVHDLASVYRMDTLMVDQEPHRSVQLIRRIDTRVPIPLLSQHITSTLATGTGTGTSVGRADSRVSGKVTGLGASASTVTSSGSSTGTVTGKWNAVAKSALGAPVSGSTTPVRVPSPAGEVKSRDVSPGAGMRPGVWVSPSVRAQREKERESVVVATPAGGSVSVVGAAEVGVAGGEDVPDDWEDDV